MKHQKKPFSSTEPPMDIKSDIKHLIELKVIDRRIEEQLEPGYREGMSVTFTDIDDINVILNHGETFKNQIKQKIEIDSPNQPPDKLPIIAWEFNKEGRNVVLRIKANPYTWRFKRKKRNPEDNNFKSKNY
ncbi:MAG: hypothetical protein ABH896_04100 [Candidatus Jacksonbacteria bacterium]